MRAAWQLILAVAALAAATAGCGSTAVTRQGPPVFYPEPPAQPRLQFLRGISSERDLARPSGFEEFLLGDAPKARAFSKPYGIAMRASKLYVTDTVARALWVVDLAENTLDQFKGAAGEGALKKPINVALGADGSTFVADSGRGQVVEYDAEDRFVRAYGEAGQMKPTDVVVTDELLYVCDVEGHEVEVIARGSGEVRGKIGKPGSNPGEFVYPTNLAMDPDGNLYVTDTGNFRIQKFSPEGKHLAVIGKVGTQPGTFTRPKGVAVDPEGRVYVVDAAFENVQIFDQQHRLLLAFGGPGAAPGNLYLPADIAIVKDGFDRFAGWVDKRLAVKYLVLVVSQYGPRRINVYAFGDWRGEVPEAEPKAKPEQAPKPKPAKESHGTPEEAEPEAPPAETAPETDKPAEDAPTEEPPAPPSATPSAWLAPSLHALGA